MGPFLIGLLWLAVLASLGIYAFRIWRRVTQGPRDVREAKRLEADAAPSASSLLQPSSDPSSSENPPPPVRRGPTFVPAPGPGPTVPSTPAAAPTDPAPAATSEPAPLATSEPTPTSSPAEGTPSPARAGLFAPRPAASPEATAPEAPPASVRPTVADALTGIAMPSGLAPLVDAEMGVNPYRVSFSTADADAATVGASVGDELERLGFEVRSVSEVGVDAIKGSVTVHVVLHPDAASEMAGERRVYPSVPPGSVVVEFST